MYHCRFDTSKKINKIFHISDIHIRLYSRIKEYKYIFNQLFIFLRQHGKKENNLIVITGDLFHSKNELSPESIILGLYFLRNLTKIYPVVLIAGNHDTLLNNNNRIDSISAILTNSNIRNLYYFKYSGVYQVNNVIFGVSSLIDNIHISYNYILKYMNNRIDNMHIIGLYHGIVGTLVTDVGYRLKGNKLISDFDGYNLVLLGDIHKHYYLDDNRRIAYASSLICQNYGEVNSDHGVLEWDLSTYESYYHNIYNPYSNVKLFYDNKRIYLNNMITEVNIEELVKRLPNFNGNIKIISDCTDNISLIKQLEDKFPNGKISCTINIESKKITYDNYIKKPLDVKEYWKKLLKDYNKNELNDIELDDLYNILLSISDNILKRNDINTSNWRLEYMKFDNFMTYGKNNYINFTSDGKITGIFANNSYGKSSLIDILTFMLFSKISRSNNVGICKDMINKLESIAYGELVFRIGNTYYKIIKELKRVKVKDRIVITKENFYSSEDKSFLSSKLLNEDHRLKTDKLITELIGTYEQFIFSSIQYQFKDRMFKDLTNKEKKDFLIKHLKLDIFTDQTIRKISDDYKIYKANLDLLMKKNDINISEINNKILVYQEEINLLEIKKREKNYRDNNYIKINILKADIKNISSKIDDNISEDNNKVIEMMRFNIDKLTNSIIEKSKQLRYTSNIENNLEEEINIIKNQILLDNNCITKCNLYSRLMLLYEKMIDNPYMYIKKLSEENEKNNHIIYDDIKKDEIQLKDLKKKIEIKIKIENDRIAKIKMNDNLKKLLEIKKRELEENLLLDDNRITLDEINNRKYLCEANIKILNRELEIYEERIVEIDKLKYKVYLYKILVHFTSNISQTLLIDYLPSIVDGINDILVPYTDRKINLELTNDVILMTSTNNIYGGMETFILDIAFKIVLSQLSVIPKSNLLIIDEGISVLDRNHINDISYLFDFLRNYYSDILVISHITDIKSNVDNYITIKKNKQNNQSFIYI